MLILSFPSLGKVKVKQLLWPTLWSILLLWLLVDAIKTSSSRGTTPTSKANSSSFSLSGKVHDVYSSLKHPSTKDSSKVDNSLSGVTANISTSNKVAVIMETRQSGGIIPLVLHFVTVLGPDWPVVIYTPAENFGSFSTSHALVRYIKAGRVVVRPLADGVYFPSWDSVSEFLTSKWMWEDLAPAEHVLIFQSDSIICANSVRSVEDFFEWDLIGAPIVPKYGIGYNGGLSLRNRKLMLRVVDEFDWHTATGMRAEDQWFYARVRELKAQEEEEGIEDGIKLPSMEIARTFAVETIDYPNPLGLHQPTRFLKNDILDDWCPEYKLARTDRIGGN